MEGSLPIYLPETHGEFRAAPKNAVHFLYGAVLHRPGEYPWTPYDLLFLFATGVLITEFLGLFAGSRLGMFFRQ